MGMINPIPKAMIEAFAAKVDQLYVIEEGDPFFEEQIRAMGIKLAGGKDLFTIQGEYSANMIRKPARQSGSRGCSRCECAGSRRRSVSGRSSWKTAASLCWMSAQRTVSRAEQAEDYCSGRHRLLYAGRAAADVSYGRMPLHGWLHNHGSRIRKSRWKQQEHSCRTGRLHLLPLRYHRSGKYELQCSGKEPSSSWTTGSQA